MTAEPGWYPDPTDASLVRWWDGERWTDERQTRPSTGKPAPAAEAAPRATASGFLGGLFSIRGRASRSEFWTAFVVLVGFGFVIAIADAMMFANGTPLETIDAVLTILLLGWLVIFVAFLMTLVRRLHDVGRSGWYVFLAFVPFGGLFLLYWATKRGDPLLNEYGGPAR